jgi:Uma2 family endonuclease
LEAIRPRRWTREEYERLGGLGILGPDEHLELIEGHILEVPRQGSRDAAAIGLAADALRAVFGAESHVRTRLPLALGQYSEPDPDVTVEAGCARDYTHAHPSTALLVVEVAETTLAFDRDVKGSLYAAAEIPEYWIVNLVDRQLEIYRNPAPMPGARYGHGYRTRTIALPGETVPTPTPTSARVAVDDLLP